MSNIPHGRLLALSGFCLLAIGSASAQTIWFVDDNAPGDPGPGNPLISDPLEDGTAAHPFDAIQEGITASASGDTVQVLDGTYTGTGNRDIDFCGRLITVRSTTGPGSCVVDLQGTTGHMGFIFQSGETSQAVLDGLSVSGGWYMPAGTGVRVLSGSPTIKNCIFSDNTAFFGGGGAFVGSPGGTPTIFTGCSFIGNSGQTASSQGGGLMTENGSVVLVDCLFEGNSAYSGGAAYAGYGSVIPVNCVFSDNTASGCGGALAIGGDQGTIPSIVNCLFTGNTAGTCGGGFASWDRAGGGVLLVNICNSTFSGNEAGQGRSVASNNGYTDFQVYNTIMWEADPFYCAGGSGFYPGYSDIQGYISGVGCINEDPLFVNPASGDFRLDTGSPCIDAANTPALPQDTYDLDGDGITAEPIPVDLDWQPRTVDDPSTVDTGIGFPCIDMGAYEFQPPTGVEESWQPRHAPGLILSVAPNPMCAITVVTYSSAGGGEALEVFDLAGRRVAVLDPGIPMPDATWSTTWDGRSSSGSQAPNGLYLVRLGTPGGGDSRVVVVLR